MPREFFPGSFALLASHRLEYGLGSPVFLRTATSCATRESCSNPVSAPDWQIHLGALISCEVLQLGLRGLKAAELDAGRRYPVEKLGRDVEQPELVMRRDEVATVELRERIADEANMPVYPRRIVDDHRVAPKIAQLGWPLPFVGVGLAQLGHELRQADAVGRRSKAHHDAPPVQNVAH